VPLTTTEILYRLREKYDVQSWWPGSSPFEVAVGAILTQQTNWRNVLLVLDNLRESALMSPEGLTTLPIGTLEDILRPSGFYRQKARRVRALAAHVLENHHGDINNMLHGRLEDSRRELLSLPGVGPETADSILLYGASRPVFVAAAYCLRILNRTGSISSDDYETVREKVEEDLRGDARDLADLYALLVELAKDHCRARPRCPGCPLEDACVFTAGGT